MFRLDFMISMQESCIILMKLPNGNILHFFKNITDSFATNFATCLNTAILFIYRVYFFRSTLPIKKKKKKTLFSDLFAGERSATKYFNFPLEDRVWTNEKHAHVSTFVGQKFEQVAAPTKFHQQRESRARWRYFLRRSRHGAYLAAEKKNQPHRSETTSRQRYFALRPARKLRFAVAKSCRASIATSRFQHLLSRAAIPIFAVGIHRYSLTGLRVWQMWITLFRGKLLNVYICTPRSERQENLARICREAIVFEFNLYPSIV